MCDLYGVIREIEFIAVIQSKFTAWFDVDLPYYVHPMIYVESCALFCWSYITRYYWYLFFHDDVIKWKYLLRYWPFVRGIHRSLVNSPHKGQWRGALMFSLICVWINGWVNTGDLRRYRAHCDVIVMDLLALGYRMPIVCDGVLEMWVRSVDD